MNTTIRLIQLLAVLPPEVAHAQVEWETTQAVARTVKTRAITGGVNFSQISDWFGVSRHTARIWYGQGRRSQSMSPINRYFQDVEDLAGLRLYPGTELQDCLQSWLTAAPPVVEYRSRRRSKQMIRNSSERRDLYQDVTDRIVAQLETGTVPWTRPWNARGSGLPLRHNGVPYRGINVIMLWMSAAAGGYTNPTWLTYRQAVALGGQVRKGERGTVVCYTNQIIAKYEDDAGEEATRRIPFLKSYTVFNAEQVDGLPVGWGLPNPAVDAVELDEGARVAHVDDFWSRVPMKLTHGGERAYYMPSRDEVRMPDWSAFLSAPQYYSTLAHEAAHWTGHKDRLDRLKGGIFGSQEYAAEELVAELGAAMMNGALGVSAQPRDDHASYIANWLRALKNDKRWIFRAATAAQAAANYLLAAGGVVLQENTTAEQEV